MHRNSKVSFSRSNRFNEAHRVPISTVVERILQWVQNLHRTPEEGKRLGDVRSVVGKTMLFAVFLIGIGWCSFRTLVPEILSWREVTPIVRVVATQQKTVFVKSFEECDDGGGVPVSCMAHPENPDLWQSGRNRRSPEYQDRVRNRTQDRFWVGITVPAEELKKAAQAHANQFLLGIVNGNYRVFIDGGTFAEGSYEKTRFNLIPLPESRLLENRPLKIAVAIEPHPGNPFPDYFNSPNGEGFVTEAQAQSYLLFSYFWAIGKPLSFFLVYLCLAGLFFLFWLCSVRKQEYSYIALWILTLAAIQMRLNSVVSRALGADAGYSLDLFLRVAEGTLGMFSGLAFARARRIWFENGIPVLLVSGGVLAFGIHDPANRLFWSQKIGLFFVVPAYLIGAFACFLQAGKLAQTKVGMPMPSARLFKLLSFGVALAALAFVYWWGANSILAPGAVVFHRIAPLFLIQLLAAIVLTEYRTHEKMIHESPATRYHLRGQVGARVRARLLQVDLKGSKTLSVELENRTSGIHESSVTSGWRRLFRGSDRIEERSAYSLLTYAWYAELARIGTEQGAEVISEQGDAIIFAYDFENGASPMDRVLATVDRFPEAHRLVRERFSLDGVLYLRGSVVGGEDLTPVWKPTGSKRRPGFEGNVLVDSKRLMDIESDLEASEGRTCILIEEGLEKELSKGTRVQSLESATLQYGLDKEGRVRRFRIYEPCDEVPAITAKVG